MRIKPSQVFICEQNEDESVRRLSNRRIDPVTGTEYNLEVNPPSDEPTSNRMIEFIEDLEATVRKRYDTWRAQKPDIEEAFRTSIKELQADRTIDEFQDTIAEEIQSGN
jgi:adenylate kinase